MPIHWLYLIFHLYYFICMIHKVPNVDWHILETILFHMKARTTNLVVCMQLRA
jgi:hypothetical protein